MSKPLTGIAAALLSCAMVVLAPQAIAAEDATYVMPSGKFTSCGPDIPGCEHVMLMGDPASGPFQKVYRMKKGFEFVKHWHSASENLVMIKGTVVLNTEGGKEQKLRAGDFVHIPANLVHWGACPEECTFYLGIEGPDSFNVVEK